jgi:hypothetical protein
MKRLRFIPLSVLLIFVVALPVFGATLNYSPSTSSITVAAGSSSVMLFSMNITNCDSRVYDVSYVDDIDGNLPSEWVSVYPSSTFMMCGRGGVTFRLNVTVPDNANGGDYSGRLFLRAMGAHGLADAGRGININVNVPASCASAPEVRVDSVEPAYLWPPNGRMEPVEITGKIILPDGCTISEAGYSIDDEYGLLSSVGNITLGPGNSFSASVPLEASRKGNDKNGRKYTITIYAADEAGIGQSQSKEVLVNNPRNK